MVDGGVSPTSSSNPQCDFESHETDASISPGEGQDASDDADYDMEDSPAAVAINNDQEEYSTSIDSHRPLKRKLGLDKKHIIANPELYGLRRSVRNIYLSSCSIY